MIKRTLYFGNPAYLSTRLEQLEVRLPEQNESKSIPIEDIAVVILDNQQITITHTVIAKLLANNVALITCNDKHHPVGLMLNLDGHTKQSKLFKHQIEAGEPLKKQIWQQTVKMKIENQGIVLDNFDRNDLYLKQLAKNVKSGDAENAEAQAAQYYWKTLSPALTKGANSFKRERFGEDPNHLLNYGYTILRAIVARSLVGSGLLPTLGIFHRNQYNAYCLADDIMEPYRPIIDNYIIDILQNDVITNELSPEIKAKLLKIPVLDVEIDKERSPLTIAVQRTTASLARSFETGKNVMIYPKQLSYKIIF